jgi:hypothetical protein
MANYHLTFIILIENHSTYKVISLHFYFILLSKRFLTPQFKLNMLHYISELSNVPIIYANTVNELHSN